MLRQPGAHQEGGSDAGDADAAPELQHPATARGRHGSRVLRGHRKSAEAAAAEEEEEEGACLAEPDGEGEARVPNGVAKPALPR